MKARVENDQEGTLATSQSRQTDRGTVLTELADLLESCRISPQSQGAVRAMLRVAKGSDDIGDALAWLGQVEPSAYALETRMLAAELFLAKGLHDQARAWLSVAEPGESAGLQPAHAPEPQPTEAATAVRPSSGAVVVDLQGRPLNEAASDAESRRITFADVGGLDQLKDEIRRKIILPFSQQGLFQKFRKRAGGGILLYGPPGCGKTLMARATAGEAKCHFLPVSVPEILSKWFGESEQRLAAIFEIARAHRPSIVFFDEIEALAGRRDQVSGSPMSAVVSSFLTLMDGATQDNDGVLIFGATNVPWAVDPAFRRQGRFDRVLFVAPPDQAARVAILNVMLAGRPGAEGVDLAKIAQRTPAFSAADLGQVVDIACDLAIDASLQRDTVVELTTALMLQAVEQTRPTTLEWLTEARNYAKFANEGGLYDDVVKFLEKRGR